MPYRNEQQGAAVVITAENTTLSAAFADAALAVWDLVVDLDSVKSSEVRSRVVVEGKNYDELLANWLKEVLDRGEIDGVVFNEFRVASIQEVNPTQFLLTGEAWGETPDAAPHAMKRDAKTIVIANAHCSESDGKAMCTATIQ